MTDGPRASARPPPARPRRRCARARSSSSRCWRIRRPGSRFTRALCCCAPARPCGAAAGRRRRAAPSRCADPRRRDSGADQLALPRPQRRWTGEPADPLVAACSSSAPRRRCIEPDAARWAELRAARPRARRPRCRPVHRGGRRGELARVPRLLPALRRRHRAAAGRLGAALPGRRTPRSSRAPTRRHRAHHRRRRPHPARLQRRSGSTNRYSLLAGFVEPGESLEAAVRPRGARGVRRRASSTRATSARSRGRSRPRSCSASALAAARQDPARA